MKSSSQLHMWIVVLHTFLYFEIFQPWKSSGIPGKKPYQCEHSKFMNLQVNASKMKCLSLHWKKSLFVCLPLVLVRVWSEHYNVTPSHQCFISYLQSTVVDNPCKLIYCWYLESAYIPCFVHHSSWLFNVICALKNNWMQKFCLA